MFNVYSVETTMLLGGPDYRAFARVSLPGVGYDGRARMPRASRVLLNELWASIFVQGEETVPHGLLWIGQSGAKVQRK